MTTRPPNPDDTDYSATPLLPNGSEADDPKADNPDDTELIDVPASLYPSDETDEG
jgi:hypothetical protein